MTSWLPQGAEQWGGRPVARTVADAAPRCRAVLAGVVGTVRWQRRALLAGTLRAASLRPGTGCWLSAVLDDGTGTVTLRWVGRERVPGVVSGASMLVEGTVLDDHGVLVS